VRVAPFVDGVPAGVHGFVSAEGIAAFRPVELVTLRGDDERALRWGGAATYFDPSADDRETMRSSVRAMGALLRARVGFRGGLTIDGICGADGWVATECNPRPGGALGYVMKGHPELLFGLAQRVAAAGDLDDLDTNALEHRVVDQADATRWGGAWMTTTTNFRDTSAVALVGDAGGYRVAGDGERADAKLELGPSPIGGFVRFTPDPARTPAGPSIAPRAVAAFALADAQFGAGLGPLAPAGAWVRREKRVSTDAARPT
jgi:hypothetical protein